MARVRYFKIVRKRFMVHNLIILIESHWIEGSYATHHRTTIMFFSIGKTVVSPVLHLLMALSHAGGSTMTQFFCGRICVSWVFYYSILSNAIFPGPKCGDPLCRQKVSHLVMLNSSNNIINLIMIIFLQTWHSVRYQTKFIQNASATQEATSVDF